MPRAAATPRPEIAAIPKPQGKPVLRLRLTGAADTPEALLAGVERLAETLRGNLGILRGRIDTTKDGTESDGATASVTTLTFEVKEHALHVGVDGCKIDGTIKHGREEIKGAE
jgi:hypothetical protein